MKHAGSIRTLVAATVVGVAVAATPLSLFAQDDLEEIMSILIQEDFLNEERFARAYVVGKFNQNKWGKVKILNGLKGQNISDYCIRKAMEEIDEDTYMETVLKLREKKESEIRSGSSFQKKQKVMRFLLSKGYDYESINKSYVVKP